MPGVPALSTSMPWVKLWIDFLDDPKIGMLPESTQLFYIKLIALAGESDAEGYLVNGETPLGETQIAWRFRLSLEATHEAIRTLIEAELVAWDEGFLLVKNFSKRQGRSQLSKREMWVERQQKSRSKKAIVTGDIGNVTSDNKNVTPVDDARHARVTPAEEEEEEEEEEEKRERRRREEEDKKRGGDWIPTNPKQAMVHPDISLFREITERIPGVGQYQTAIQTIQLLRQKIPEDKALIVFLGPFWQAWTGRKSKNGRPYDASSLVWLTEWAVNGEIPPDWRPPAGTANGNGKHNDSSIFQRERERLGIDGDKS